MFQRARECVCVCVGVHNCLYATPAACMYLHSHFNLCARRRPTGPQTMSLVLCALTCYMQMRFLPACPATSTHTVHTRRCCSCCCSHFSCCCCLLLSLLLVICRRVRGRLRVRTNKYCNDVCDFFYAPSCATQKQALSLLYLLPCLPAYQFIEISLGRPATTTWHSTRAKFVVGKICNIRFNEVTTWQRVKKRVIKNMLEKINKQSTAEMY